MEENRTTRDESRSDRDLANEDTTGGADVWQPETDQPSEGPTDRTGTAFDPSGSGGMPTRDTTERSDQPSPGYTGRSSD